MQKLFFRNFICRKLFFRKNSIGISVIPFITRYKGNHRNPYRILDFSKKNPKFPKISKNIFFEKKFHLEKKSRSFSEHLCRSKISQRFQKSYLEQRTMRLKMRTISNPVFFSELIRFPYSSVHCYVHRP